MLEPASKRGGILIGGHGGNQTAAANVVRAVQSEARAGAVDAPAAHGLTDADLHAASSVVASIAVRRRAPEVRLRERRQAFATPSSTVAA